MRAARRGHFVERLNILELLYRVYLFAIFGGIGLAYLGGVIDEAAALPSAVDSIREDGPAVLGIAIAVVALAGLRAGARGGPLAIEPAEVQYVLLAPIGRAAALRPAAIRQLRIGAAAGAVGGAIVASFVCRRLPGSPVEWIASLAVLGALLPVTFLSAALLASGRRLSQPLVAALGSTLLAWSVADLVLGLGTAPTTLLGELGTLPLQSGSTAALAGVGVAAALALLAAGLLGIGGMLLEAARRRARLAAELRFSASVQDLRTVILLRRQLASERPRRRPWLRLGIAGAGGRPVWRRAWQSFLRWPLARIGRVVGLALATGAAAVGAWHVSIVLAVVPGALLFVAALDLVEPLAQESDHPTRTQLLPVAPGHLIRSHLIAPGVALTLVVAVAALAAAAISGDAVAFELGAVAALPTGFGLALCAALSATNDPYEFILNPTLGYTQTFGPMVAALVFCAAPILVGRAAWLQGNPTVGPALGVEVALAMVAVGGAEFLARRMTRRQAVAA
jgi:hypothetical protein